MPSPIPSPSISSPDIPADTGVDIPADTPADTRADLRALGAGLSAAEQTALAQSLTLAQQAYGERCLSSGETMMAHALGMAMQVAELRMDAECRIAALLFAWPVPAELPERLGKAFDPTLARDVGTLVSGISRLESLHVVTRPASERGVASAADPQAEILRKMLLAMVQDIRVVMLRLASRTQTLRWLSLSGAGGGSAGDDQRRRLARETLDIYAPLANRLGVWQLKWELEDLSFRFLEPDTYRQIAGMLDERRAEREAYIAQAIVLLQAALQAAGVPAEVSGRPKHIYSIWNKMQNKSLSFDQLYDLRALRILVPELKDCYSALGVVHNLWQPIPREFDDYISRPKGNHYRSLHTAVTGPQGRGLEVQIRTHDMHHEAELGVAAHWRYKEGRRAGDPFDQKIAWLRQVLAWRDDVVDSADWLQQFKQAALDDTVYVLTPQGKVIDLPTGSTPVDFAYALHTDLGHRCRGAKVNGAIVPLDTPLATGQRVEILTSKQGGPSRDWLNAELGYIRSGRARNKVRQWFNALALEQAAVAGRVQRSVESADADALQREAEPADTVQLHSQAEARLLAHSQRPASGVLIVGVDRLLTQLARCCKPVPPDAIRGFVTRGRGISVHRADCSSLQELMRRVPERLIEAQWGGKALADAGVLVARGVAGGALQTSAQSGAQSSQASVYAADFLVRAHDRQGLLRDISEVLTRQRVNVIASNTQSRQGVASMHFTAEVKSLAELRQALGLLSEVSGVIEVSRR
jgi:GTP pyrophosphokinase